MAITHTCPECRTVHHLEEINDDARVDPKFKLSEIVQIVGRQSVMFRIERLDKMRMILEKMT